MATKQLNSVSPRNFREKIELLKKKEAACTANFAAAIRDAREILQIAGACDGTQVKSLAVQSLLERSLSKSCSKSNTPCNILRDNSTESVTENVEQNKFDNKGSSQSTNCSGQEYEPTQLLTSSTNEHLMSLLSSSVAASNNLDESRSAVNRENWQAYASRVPGVASESAASHPYIASLGRAPTRCSPSSAASGHHGTVSISTASPYRRVQRYASGDQLPSVGFSGSTHLHHSDISRSKHADSSSPPFDPKAMMSSYVEDDPSMRPISYGQHISTGSRGLYTAQTSLGPLHSSSPYCGTQLAGTYPRVCDASGVNHNMSSLGPGVPSEHAAPATSTFNLNFDWRRVSSDSSIHHTLMSYPAAITDQRGYDCHTSSIPSEAHTGSCLTSIPIKRSETLRRHFPTEPDVVRTAAYSRMGRYSPSGLPTTASSIPAVIPSDASLGEDHAPPAKRPFTGSSMQMMNTASPAHYSQMNDLPLNDLNAISNQSAERQMLNVDAVDVTHTTTTAKMPPPNVGSHNLLKLKSPGRSADNTESSSDLNSLTGYDSGDLDRYLQIPPAFLDSEGVERWAGRRDSCTMTAEVLSALNATNADSPVTLDRSKCDSTGTAISVANKFLGHLDMRSTSDGPNNYYDHAPTAPLFDSSQMQPSDFQNMASKLGISMTPNDYQLLTNPQLANYVTDETTETQLLG